jgi:hypothetical protein
MAAARAFFRSAKAATGVTPGPRHHGRARLLPAGDPHDARPAGRAPDQRVQEQRLEQDHRGVKGRIRCMRGFKSFARPSASVEATTNSATSSASAPATTSATRTPPGRERRQALPDGSPPPAGTQWPPPTKRRRWRRPTAAPPRS